MSEPPPLPPTLPESQPEQPGEEKLPDWLIDLSGTASEPEPGEGEASVPPLLPQADQETPSVIEEPTQDEPAKEFIPEDDGSREPVESTGEKVPSIPDWLVEMAEPVPGQEPPQPASTLEPTPGKEIEPQPPGQPVEAGSDPLANLEGALPLPSESPEIKKPAAYPAKMVVSNEQQDYIAILEKIFSAKQAVESPPGEKTRQLSPLARFLVLSVLIIAILIPLVMGVPQMQPVPVSQDIDSAWQEIEALPKDAQVIVAVEYDPASSAELEAASFAIFEHLLTRQARLFLLSTSPTGPLLAERLIQTHKTHQDETSFTLESYQVTNLGYLPGGPIGLASFVRNPGQILNSPFTPTQTGKVVGANILSRIESFKDVSLVLVLTESPDTARMWIEQVQPYLRRRPMLMVLSAQVEPVVRPYAEGATAPIDGMVVGVAGGAAYERLNGLETADSPAIPVATRIWSAYGIGAWATALLIAITSMINLIRVKTDKDRQVKEEDR